MMRAGDEPSARLLRAAIDRIIPPDEFPGAWEAGAGEYIMRQLGSDLRHLAQVIAEGLASLDREALHACGQGFASLGPEEQDRLLQRVADGDVQTTWITAPAEFFLLLVRLTNEGYYSDPGQGGNRDEVAWRMIGYQTRVPVERQR